MSTTLKPWLSKVLRLTFSKDREKGRSLRFVDREPIEMEEESDLILSPAFYWVRVERLPVTKLREAKKLFPALFDGHLPEGNYSYMGIQSSDDPNLFTVFAYDEEVILRRLRALGVDPRRVGRIYFAQFFESCFDKPVAFESDFPLVSHNGIVCRLPAYMVEEKGQSVNEFYSCARAKKMRPVPIILVEGGGSMADRQGIYRVAGVMLVIAFLFLIEGGYYWWQKRKLTGRNHALLQEYKIPATGYQRRAILAKLEKKRKAVVAERELLAALTRLPLAPGEKVRLLSLKGRRIEMVVALADVAHAEKIKAYLERYLRLDRIELKGDNLRVEAHIS